MITSTYGIDKNPTHMMHQCYKGTLTYKDIFNRIPSCICHNICACGFYSKCALNYVIKPLWAMLVITSITYEENVDNSKR